MGGHGGLNILPQKRWNVYNRDNRLKVARDEANYEAEQQVIRDKHAAAEREYRHKLLLERARERHGGRANVVVDFDGDNTGELPDGFSQGIEEDTGALQAHARLVSSSSLQQQHNNNDGYNFDPMAALEQETIQEERKQPQKRQRTAEQLDKGGATTTKPPTLAELATHHMTPNNQQQSEEQPPIVAVATAPSTAQPLQHINLFAEEESRANNPEVLAEQREVQRRRGKKETQTSDAKFDAQFQFAHGLSGRGSVPWYAQQRIPSTGTLSGTGGMGGGFHSTEEMYDTLRGGSSKSKNNVDAMNKKSAISKRIEGVKQMEEWKRQATAALTATHRREHESHIEDDDKTTTTIAIDIDKQQQQHIDNSEFLLIQGVVVNIPNEQGNKDAKSIDSSDSDSSDRDDEKRRHRRRKEKKKKKDNKTKKEKKESSHARKKREKAELMMKLREERIQRENKERQRQREILTNSHGTGTKRYYGGYGYGR